MGGDFEKVLQTLQCQFLSCFPVNNIEWEKISNNLSWEQQELIVKNTRGHHLNKLHPIKNDYQLNFLKRLIHVLERNCSEVHDDVYNEYCKVQLESASSSDDYIYKHYVIPKFNVQLTMQEAKTFVSKGTTGLCTWQASLALADFLLHNQGYIKNKRVIDLGAGTGLCGMILMKCEAAKVMSLTDGSLECVRLMKTNILRNFQEAIQQEDSFFKLTAEQDHLLGAFHLPWEQANEFEFSENLRPELILAADVVYDDTLFEDLMHAIEVTLKNSCRNTKMLLAATVRNEDTLETFLKLVSKNHLVKACFIVPEPESYIQWNRATSVRIFEITKNTLV